MTVAVMSLAGSKKISSEEETYSDHSILIFYHNTAGMYSVYSPFQPLLQASNSSLAKVRMCTLYCFSTLHPIQLLLCTRVCQKSML